MSHCPCTTTIDDNRWRSKTQLKTFQTVEILSKIKEFRHGSELVWWSLNTFYSLFCNIHQSYMCWQIQGFKKNPTNDPTFPAWLKGKQTFAWVVCPFLMEFSANCNMFNSQYKNPNLMCPTSYLYYITNWLKRFAPIPLIWWNKMALDSYLQINPCWTPQVTCDS